MSEAKKTFHFDGLLMLTIALLVAGAIVLVIMLISVVEGYRALAACASVMMMLYFVGAGYAIRLIQEDEDGDG